MKPFPIIIIPLLLGSIFLFFWNLKYAFSVPTFDDDVTAQIPNSTKLEKFNFTGGESATFPLKGIYTTESSLKKAKKWSPRPYEPYPRPALEDLVVGWNVTGNLQWLINFAIIGFPKCGTSTLMHYFRSNPEVHMDKDERCELGANQHVTLVRSMYSDFPAGDYVRGIKCPQNLESNLAMENFQRFFPKTDIVIGIRHPVKWFESFYNHRIQNGFSLPNASSLTGGCRKGAYGVCTNRADFHYYLSRLGFTKMTDEEKELMPSRSKKGKFQIFNITGRVFLYEVEQLGDEIESRSKEFRVDLQNYLYLENELPPMVWFKPGRAKEDEVAEQLVSRKKIDICDEANKNLRGTLMISAKYASRWIRDYFIHNDRVVVSNPDHFNTLLKNWEADPCIDGNSHHKRTRTENCTKYGCFLSHKRI